MCKKIVVVIKRRINKWISRHSSKYTVYLLLCVVNSLCLVVLLSSFYAFYFVFLQCGTRGVMRGQFVAADYSLLWFLP